MKRIIFEENLYPSSAFYVLKQLGLIPGAKKAKFKELGSQMSSLGESFNFKASLYGGPLYTLMFHIPSYLEITPIEFDKYFKAITEFVKTKNLNVFIEKWPNKTKYFKEWFNTGWINYLSDSIDHDPSRALAIVETYLLILHDLWGEYSEIYKEKFRALNLSISVLEEKYNALSIFEKWEDSFKRSYPYDYFEIIISPESDYRFSRVGPEKIVVKSKNYGYFDEAVHEIGIRTIDMDYLANSEFTKNLFEEDYVNVIKLMEVETIYRVKTLFPKVDSKYIVLKKDLDNILKFRESQEVGLDLAKSFACWYKELKKLKYI